MQRLRFASCFLPMEFPYSRNRIIPLDREKMIGHFARALRSPFDRSSEAWVWLVQVKDWEHEPFAHAGNMITRNWWQVLRSTFPWQPKAQCSKQGWPRRPGKWGGGHHRHGDLPYGNVQICSPQKADDELASSGDSNTLHHHGIQSRSKRSDRACSPRHD